MLQMVMKVRSQWSSVLANAVLSFRGGGEAPFHYCPLNVVLLRWPGRAPDEVGVVGRIALKEFQWHHDNRLPIHAGLQ